MQDWINESAKLVGRWDKVAASKALLNLQHSSEKGVDEMLMGYALAQLIYQNVFSRFVSQKQTLSQEDTENLELAIQLARLSIPVGHPLLYLFLKNASFIDERLSEEAQQLKTEL